MNKSLDKQIILIVDDEPVNIKLLQVLLKDDYRLLAATSGEKALQIALSDPQPDLILLDVMMPYMDGFTVLQKLKQNPRTSNIATLFVTAKLTEADENRGLSLGALDYLIKPINVTAVKIKVQTHLNAIRQQKFITSLVAEQGETIAKNSGDNHREQVKSEQLVKQYLDTIQQEKERLHLALWASGNELWDWDLSTGKIERSNKSSNILLPQTTVNALAATSLDIAATYRDYVHPKDMGRFEQALQQVFNGASKYFELEYRVKAAAGGWVWIRDQGRIIAQDNNSYPQRMIGTIKDINARKKAEQNSRTLARSFKNTSDGIWIADSDLRVEIVNKAFTGITGFQNSDVVGKCIDFPATANQKNNLIEHIKKQLIRNNKWSGEVWAQGRDKIYPQELRIDAIHNEEDDSTQYVGVFTDITYRKRAEEELIKLANYDHLTGLPNRTLFNERLSQATIKSRLPPSKFAVLFIDLDNFKRVNDSLGHDIGDELLVSVANNLSSILRNDDIVARLGGDEFIMIVDNLNETHVAAKVAQRIINSVTKIRLLNGHEVIVTPSIGIAIFPDDGETSEQLIKHADRAMYVSKHIGKGTYRFFTESMNSNALERLDMETALRKAIENDEIDLHYQPKVDLKSGELHGLEVLARWSRDGIQVLPDLFIRLAEEAGLIKKLGKNILYKACSQYQKWVKMGITRGRIAINLSSQQFEDEELVSHVTRVLQETGLSACHLELEITETMVVSETEKAIRQMHALRDIGISLAIDDFGTGYSSLSYLKEFPINTLKIDRCFIDDMLTTKRSKNIVKLIIEMAHTLGMQIVAEGVETKEQAEALKTLQAEEMQGYLYSKPLPADEFEILLTKRINLDNKHVEDSPLRALTIYSD